MNALDLLDAIGGAEDSDILLAQKTKKKHRWIPWTAAACLLLAIGVGALLPRPKPITEPIPETHTLPAQVNSETGVWIPPIELPKPEEAAMADMIACVMVDGNLYTQGETCYDDDAARVEPLLGEKLGDATGTIDCFSDDSEYEKPFASTLAGEVFTVQGYDPDFRVAVRNVDSEGRLSVWFLDHLNGIYLNTGADLFEERLHLRDRIASIQWQAHSDWDWNRGGMQNAALSEEEWSVFLDAVDAGEFVNTWQPDAPFYEGHPNSSIYDTPNQAHLFLTMTDGTRVPLRLIEGGYVGYSVTGWWYFVHIPGEAFDAVYNACGGTHLTDW